MNEIRAARVLAAAINRIPYANIFVKDKIVWGEAGVSRVRGDRGDRPPRYGEKTAPFHIGREPVPCHRSRDLTLAGQHAAATPVGQERLLLTRL